MFPAQKWLLTLGSYSHPTSLFSYHRTGGAEVKTGWVKKPRDAGSIDREEKVVGTP